MRRRLCGALLFLALAPALFAAPPEVPPALKTQAGQIEELTVKVPAGADIGFRLVGGKAVFREMKPDDSGTRVFWFSAKEPGQFAVVWWTKGETGSSITTIDAGTPVPIVPPVPPAPTDPLIQTLQAAHTPEADPAKLKTFAELMGSIIAAARASGVITTTAQLQDKVHQATDLALGAGSLPATRKAVGAYLVSKLGNTSQPMTPDLWTKIAAEYATVSAALGKVK